MVYAAPRYFAYSYFGGIWPEGGALAILPGGISQEVVFGTPSIVLEVQEVFPTGITQPIAFGTPSLSLSILPAGITQGVTFGTPSFTVEIQIEGFDPNVQFGIPNLFSPEFPLNVRIKPVESEDIESQIVKSIGSAIATKLLSNEGLPTVTTTTKPSIIAKPIPGSSVSAHTTTKPVIRAKLIPAGITPQVSTDGKKTEIRTRIVSGTPMQVSVSKQTPTVRTKKIKEIDNILVKKGKSSSDNK